MRKTLLTAAAAAFVLSTAGAGFAVAQNATTTQAAKDAKAESNDAKAASVDAKRASSTAKSKAKTSAHKAKVAADKADTAAKASVDANKP